MSNQLLSVFLNVFAYSDGTPNNNPRLQDFSYSRQIPDQPTSKTRSQQFVISSSERMSVLALQRNLTTGASWTVSSVPGTYTARFTWSGVDPVLRVSRTGSTLVNSDTFTVTRQGSSKVVRLDFGSKKVGDSIISGDSLYLGPDLGITLFSGNILTIVGVQGSGSIVDILSEDMPNQTVTIEDSTQIYAFSSGPAGSGDFINIGDSFSFGNRGEYRLSSVTSKFFDIQNSEVIPEGPITADLKLYEQVYKITYIEVDQKVNAYINGNIVPIVIEPYITGQSGLCGFFLWRGPVFSIEIENLGTADANVTTFFAT